MPETNSAILEARRRARDYWDIDGLPALLAGAATVSVGVILLPAKSHLPWWGAGLTFGSFALYFLAESEGTVEWLKSRITYPRTGYVAPQKSRYEGRASRKAIEFSDPPFLLLLLLWWLFSFNGWLASLACLAIALWFWWKNKKDPPWFEIAGAAIAGLLSAILTVSDRRRFCIVLIVFGASGMVKGATLLISYLRQHPAQQA
ncbi:MAG TPA: hypothetical protein VH024_15850 [Candidatus Angelobacter sp.]|nr:hypothetical protein [Candidatus Angelobacter sp.]